MSKLDELYKTREGVSCLAGPYTEVSFTQMSSSMVEASLAAIMSFARKVFFNHLITICLSCG